MSAGFANDWHGRSVLCTALVTVLSWLGLPVCAQTQTAGIEKVLRELDAAFGEGDVERYLGVFEPDHPGSHALLDQRLRRLLPQAVAGKGRITRKSTVLGEPRRVGPRHVVRVRHELFDGDTRIAADLEDSIIAFRMDGSGPPVPTFTIETPRQIDCPAGDVFKCPPCNYEIGGAAGWLCVPMGRDKAQALEASSFFLLGTDLACDVSVRIDTKKRTPIQLVTELGSLLRSFEPTAEVGLATAWLPPAHARAAEDRPADTSELRGARVEIAVPNSDGEPGIALFHAVQLGSLQHLLLVRGSAQAASEHAAKLDELLTTFRLIRTNAAAADAGAIALLHHVGGAIENGTYRNVRHAASMAGPAEWKAQQRCGGALFRVVWESPDGSRLWLTGFSVPPGMKYWCNQTAAHWLERLCDTAGLELPAEVEEWESDKDCEARTRTVTCTLKEPPDPTRRTERVLRVMFREDLLVVADGTAKNEADWRAVRAALATLRLD